MSLEEKSEIADLQMKLDELYLSKARGAYIRSRKEMARRGRTQFCIFFKLEKRNIPSQQLNNVLMAKLLKIQRKWQTTVPVFIRIFIVQGIQSRQRPHF